MRKIAHSTVFKSGDGHKVSSLGKVIIPAKIGYHSINIAIDIVENIIPLLLSKESMKKLTLKMTLQMIQFHCLENKYW